MKVLLVIILAISCVFAYKNSDKFISEINNKQSLWKAGRNFHKGTPLSRIRGLLGAKRLPPNLLKNIPVMKHIIDKDIPESFDARIQWSKCKSIGKVADQSACGSCWAVSVTSTISDRICIHSDGKFQPEISAKNLMACDKESYGCEGGYPSYAWFYWKNNGIVTGGPYGSKNGCQPYPFAECEHSIQGSKPQCSSVLYKTPECVKTCDNSSVKYENDLIHGVSGYIIEANETQIQQEILKSGPVVSTFDVFTDFLHYKSGIYIRTTDEIEGRHGVRIIGWGVENGTKYWLVANSWNEDWGEKGLFRIRRGVNECEIEQEITGGLPKKKN